MPHGRGLPSGERPSCLRGGHDWRAVRPRSCPPSNRRPPSDARCRRQCILRLRASRPSHMLRPSDRHELRRRAIHPRGWPGKVREGVPPFPIQCCAPDGDAASGDQRSAAPRRSHGKPAGFAKVRFCPFPGLRVSAMPGRSGLPVLGFPPEAEGAPATDLASQVRPVPSRWERLAPWQRWRRRWRRCWQEIAGLCSLPRTPPRVMPARPEGAVSG